MRRLLVGLAVLSLGALPAFAQEGAEVEIVDINTSRYADGGRTSMVIEVRNLPGVADPSLLEITTNGQEVLDLAAASIRESAVALGVVLAIDVSGHMEGEPLDAAKTAAQELVAQASTGDQVALIAFADDVRVVSGLTTNRSTLNQQIAGLEAVTEAEGNTRLNDAVNQGVTMLTTLSARDLVGSVIVVAGAADAGSQATQEQTITAVSESNVRVFGLAVEFPDVALGPVEQITTASGGTFLSTPDAEQLPALQAEIDREFGNTLVARFLSPVFTPGAVEFAVGYGGASSSIEFTVSGYATTTTTGAEAAAATLAPVTTRVVESSLPLDSATLMLIGVAGIGLTVFLFMVILFGREGDEGGSRFTKRLQAYGRRGTPDEEKKPLLERIPLFNRFAQAAEEEVQRRGLLSGVNATLEQANIPMSPGEAILALFGVAAVSGVFAAIVYGPTTGGIVFAGLILLSIALIRFSGSREKKRFESQLPDTLTLMSTSLRAGYSLLQAIEAVATEAPNPTSREFGRGIAEARLGVTVSDALNGIAERTKSADFAWAVMAIEIQREVGGNLAEVLQTVGDTMRARGRLKGEIQALTAEGRISAFVLGSLPFFMGGFLWTTNRSYLEPLFETTFGRIAIAVGLLLMAAGIFWLKKIVDIEI